MKRRLARIASVVFSSLLGVALANCRDAWKSIIDDDAAGRSVAVRHLNDTEDPGAFGAPGGVVALVGTITAIAGAIVVIAGMRRRDPRRARSRSPAGAPRLPA